MDLIRLAMNRPVTITVGVLLVVMFGLLGLFTIPVQLTPTVDKPVITVTTVWPGRSPEEVVNEITREQEKYLKNVPNLKNMRSVTTEGNAEVTLEFYLGADLTRALQEVSDSLRQVPAYPDEVDEPTIKAADGGPSNAIAWIIIDIDPAKLADHPGYDISTLYDAMDREVKPYLERIDGVAEVNIYGGREREVEVFVDPVALAQRGLSHESVVAALRGENRNISAGTISEGKRDYRVRLVGQYSTAEDVLATTITYRDGRPVLVRDVATVELGHQKRRGFVRAMGHPCMAMNIIRQSGSNVMTIMADVRERLVEVQREILPRLEPALGNSLRIRQVYDETTYIDSAINLVTGNLWSAAAITVVTLLIFLRAIRPTLIIALAIPVCMTGTFLVMVAAGRTLNVISLAALAFATGVVVDASNVVIDNIERRLAMGEPVGTAIYLGTREVWAAVLAGGLTSAAVFVPVLTIREEVGQLFFDISFALGVSTLLSLLVAILVVPAAANVLYRGRKPGAVETGGPLRRAVFNVFGLVTFGAWVTSCVARVVHWLMTSWRGWTLRPVLIVLMTLLSIGGSMWLMPPLDYLPKGNRNLVFGGVLIPPGLSVEEMENYAERMERVVGPYLTDNLPAGTDPNEAVKALPQIANFHGEPFEPVAVSNLFIGAFGGSMFAGGVSADEQVVIPVGQLLTNSMSGLPDAFGGAGQSSIFGGIEGGNSIDVEISGPDLERVKGAAGMIFGMAGARFGFGLNVQPSPSNFNLVQPEWRLRLSTTGRELGLTTADLGTAVRALFDGAIAGDFLLDGRNVDLMVKPVGGRLGYKEQLTSIPVMTPAGKRVPMSQVAEVITANAPQSIQRIEELPSVTIQVTPPDDMTIEEVMRELDEKMIAVARATGVIDPTMRVRMEGTAAKLDEVKAAMFGVVPLNPERRAMFAKWGRVGIFVVGTMGVVAAAATVIRAFRRKRLGAGIPASVAVLLASAAIGILVWAFLGRPELLSARFVWALAVTYLLMCALFESFLLPLVIMFSVPLAMVGGFAALSLVHHSTMRDPTIAPQQLDVLTMLGFVILIGTVVNNAILLVEQAINFMHPEKFGSDAKPLAMHDAIAESVRTRIRPIMMTTMTTVGGGLPLVLAPGAGSEMYRGLGAVVVGGLIVSTIFTLLLVPLVLSLVFELVDALKRVWAGGAPDGNAPMATHDRDTAVMPAP